MEVVRKDSRLVIDGREFECFANGVGDERSIVYRSGHLALVARQHEDMVEVEVACFEHAHYLDALDRLTVEGDGGAPNELRDELLQRSDVYR